MSVNIKIIMHMIRLAAVLNVHSKITQNDHKFNRSLYIHIQSQMWLINKESINRMKIRFKMRDCFNLSSFFLLFKICCLTRYIKKTLRNGLFEVGLTLNQYGELT